uniref:Cytochrome P450 n=1 Tax=Timema douglasi TaxID=61478 RepID=A0A7R8VCN3_TIMDO|nr:unnamed protein product [Timema douglasi]
MFKMGLLFESLWPDVVVATATVVVMIYWKLITIYSYWSSKGVPNPKPHFFYGNTKEFMLKQTTQAEVYQKLYNDLEGHPFGGVYQGIYPYLMLRDPETIKLFMTKDFSHFTDKGFATDEKRAPLSANLALLSGKRWRSLRVKLTPTFTSGKMKMMLSMVAECAERLKESLKNASKNGEILEVKQIAGQYTMEVIGSCAFGIQVNSISNDESEFVNFGKRFLTPPLSGKLRGFIRNFLPFLGQFLIFIRDKKLEEFIGNMVLNMVRYREENNIERGDFLQMLMELKKKGKLEGEISITEDAHLLKMTDNLMVAQCYLFLIAGFETSSGTMSFCLYELAINQNVQSRLMLEVDQVVEDHGGNITYEAIQKMKYMDQVVDETLRKHPPVGNIDRTCTKAYTIPGTKVHLEKGTKVKIPVYALHYDPKYYPDPHKFDPERFNEENKRKRHTYTYLPFGEGPRMCIGMRFAIMQIKVGLAVLLLNYRFSICPLTKIPIVLEPKHDILAVPKDGLFLKISNRKKC